jgi:hypothetical protein
VLADAASEQLATRRRQELRVAQATDAIIAIQNYRCCHHRPEKRATPNFIHTGYQLRALGPCLLLKFQCAAQPFEQAQLERSFGNLRFYTVFADTCGGVSRHFPRKITPVCLEAGEACNARFCSSLQTTFAAL